MSRFPNGCAFAFTVFDDTDRSTIENVGPVYRFLAELGFKTTKSVWSLAGVENARIGGATLEDEGYRKFVCNLKQEGFEIALHNIRNHDTPRELVRLGLERFYDAVGCMPRTQCNHDTNRENIYWGPARIADPVIRFMYNVATGFRYRRFYEGHLESSRFFWGDICKEQISYVRNFVFDEINLDQVNPTMPYHDPAKPYVNLWFSSTSGGDVESFCEAISEVNQDRLEEQGGVCIMYTHFAAGFVKKGEINPTFGRLMRRLAKKNGWFVPVASLLDHLHSSRNESTISEQERKLMERRWFLSKLCNGTQ